jgi:hypothetical protein
MPAGAAAFQTVTIETAPNGAKTLHIVGDKGKPTDEVKVRYDSVHDEYVIGHDVDMVTPPEGCKFTGGGPPYKKLRCPGKGIRRIVIDTGVDADRVKVSDLWTTGGLLPGIFYIPRELEGVEVNAGQDNDSYEDPEGEGEEGGEGEEAPGSPGPNPVDNEIDMGDGVDVATVHGGDNKVVYEGSGRLTVTGGENKVQIVGGNSLLSLGGGENAVQVGDGNSRGSASGGVNHVVFGDGNSSFSATAGQNSVLFGVGNGVFSGGTGTDKATFGAGNNTFSGGGGADIAVLGKGHDTAKGGPGADKLYGGKANDRLVGGPGKDLLNGGPGNRDTCTGGERLIACELPCQETGACQAHCPGPGPSSCDEACPPMACHQRAAALSSPRMTYRPHSLALLLLLPLRGE